MDYLIIGKDVNTILLLVLLTVLLNFVVQIEQKALGHAKNVQMDCLGRNREFELSGKMVAIPYEQVESAEPHFKLQKICESKVQVGDAFCSLAQLLK